FIAEPNGIFLSDELRVDSDGTGGDARIHFFSDTDGTPTLCPQLRGGGGCQMIEDGTAQLALTINWFLFDQPNGSDQIFFQSDVSDAGPGTGAVPESGSLQLVLVGIAGLGLLRRRATILFE